MNTKSFMAIYNDIDMVEKQVMALTKILENYTRVIITDISIGQDIYGHKSIYYKFYNDYGEE